MKSLRHLSTLSWLVALAGAVAFASTSLAQSETLPQKKEISKSEPKCPTVSVSCPSQRELGQGLTFAVTVNGGDPEAVLTYSWTASRGTIVEGQGTATIKLDTAGLGFNSITATVTIGGLSSGCGSTASCSILGEHLPRPSSKLDSYGLLPRSREKERLKIFATALNNDPGTQGYVLSYGGQRDVAGAARAAGERAKAYLVKGLGIAAERIVIVEGGFKEKLTVDLWIVPAGATPPQPTPTVDRGPIKP